MAIKRIKSEIKRAELAALAADYRMVVVGNYHSDASHLIKAALVQRGIEVKRRVVGVRAQRLTLVVTNMSDGLSALAARTFRQIGINIVVETELTEAQREAMELVLVVRLELGDKVAEATRERMEEQFERAVEPWSDNDKQFEIKVLVVTDLVAKPAIDLTKVDLADPKNDKRNDYSGFTHIDQWKDQAIREVEPTIDRSDIPAYGPGIFPDGDKAGGLQES